MSLQFILSADWSYEILKLPIDTDWYDKRASAMVNVNSKKVVLTALKQNIL